MKKSGRIGKKKTRTLKEQNGQAKFINCPDCGIKRYGFDNRLFFHPCDNCAKLRLIEKKLKIIANKQ